VPDPLLRVHADFCRVVTHLWYMQFSFHSCESHTTSCDGFPMYAHNPCSKSLGASAWLISPQIRL
jgi:hypothetical protein